MVCWRLGKCLTMSVNWPSADKCSDIEFVDRISHAVALVRGAVRVAGV